MAFGNKFKRLLKKVEAAFKVLHNNGSYKPEDLMEEKAFKEVVEATNGFLKGAVSDNEISDEMRKRLEEDIFLFSGLKTHAQLFEASRQLLTEDGTLKSYEAFAADVQDIPESHQRYLEAEYDFATSSVLMAERWENFSDSDRYYLQYRTANDDRVRDTHEALHDITLPKSDKFWDYFFPPNGWRCRCTVVEILRRLAEASDSKSSEKLGKKATTQKGKSGKNKLELFRFNPGREKVVFPKEHPYSKVLGAKRAKAIIKKRS